MKILSLLITLCSISFSLWAFENQDWITEHDWSLEDGRHLVDPSIEQVDWIGYKTPLVTFNKFEIPSDSNLYQVRLRNERFYYRYQTAEEKDKLYPVGTSFIPDVLKLEFRNNYSNLSLFRVENQTDYGIQNRVGQQISSEYPLVGIWGNLPNLDEYRLVDPLDCIYFMDIDREIPNWAVRRGTYLLKQIGDTVFETISSFPDGQLRLEILNERIILLTPLFTLPNEEEGLVAHLAIRKIPFRISKEEEIEEANDSYNELLKNQKNEPKVQIVEISEPVKKNDNIWKYAIIISMTITIFALILIIIIKKRKS